MLYLFKHREVRRFTHRDLDLEMFDDNIEYTWIEEDGDYHFWLDTEPMCKCCGKVKYVSIRGWRLYPSPSGDWDD